MPDGDARLLRIGDGTVRVTNPAKVLFPATGTTKADLIAYYAAIAPVMLPHLDGRIVTRKRWPHGTGPALPAKGRTPATDTEPFFTKNLDSGTPDWVPRAAVEHHSRLVTYPLVEDIATLVWCAQMAAIELHVPQWRLPEQVRRGGTTYLLDAATAPPDRLVVDLDPGPGVTLEQVCEVALAARELLEGMGLVTVPVTSGSKGLHLYARLSGVSAEAASALAAELAEALAAELPALAITTMKRSLREGRVFVDHTQNNPAKTTVSPYSVRGRERPWVAAPRAWSELEDAHAGRGAGLAQLLMAEVLERVADGDRFAPLTPPGVSARAELVDPAELSLLTAAETAPRLVRKGPEVGAEGPRGRAAQPPRPKPMLASHHDPFNHPDLDPPRWAIEPKWDGYRVIVTVANDGAASSHVRLTSRSGRDLTPEFPELLTAPGVFAAHTAVLDGEIVALDDDARPSFHALQRRSEPPRPPLRLVLFDVLRLDGVDLTSRPLTQRREVLEALDLPLADPTAAGGMVGRVIEGEHGWCTTTRLGPTLADALEASSAVGGEGVVAKRADSSYLPGKRTSAWVKVKHQAEARVVIGGWQPGAGRRAGGIGSLLLGIRDDDGRLRYVGKVGTGFTDAELARLGALLEPLRTETNPFDSADGPVPAAQAKVAVWVRPEVEAEVGFDSWTPDGVLRAARWQGVAQ